nr:hypothetical protein [Halostagnicola sp. A56]
MIERNFILSFSPGLSVIMAMTFSGEWIAIILLEFGVPYGAWIGVGIGVIVVFTVFAAVYTRLDSVYGDRL